MKRPWLVLICGLFIFLFVYTAMSKLLGMQLFLKVLRESPVTGSFAPLIGWGVPAVELMIAVLLLLPRTRFTGLCAAVALMTVFTLYIIYMLVFASQLPCSCGGVIGRLSWKQHLVFNLAWIAVGAVAISKYPKRAYAENP